MGYRAYSGKESDLTEATQHVCTHTRSVPLFQCYCYRIFHLLHILQNLFISSPLSGCTRCFHIFVITKNAAMNILVFAFLGYMLRGRNADLKNMSIFNDNTHCQIALPNGCIFLLLEKCDRFYFSIFFPALSEVRLLFSHFICVKQLIVVSICIYLIASEFKHPFI